MIRINEFGRGALGSVKNFGFDSAVIKGSFFGSFVKRLTHTYTLKIRQLFKIVFNFVRMGFACLLALSLAGPAHAFDADLDILKLPAPNATPTSAFPDCLGAFYGRALNTRIHVYQNQSTMVGGGYWNAGADTITPTPSVTPAMLADCGYTNPTIIWQVGPTAPTYALDDYIGIIWRAS